jgi:hypothetical protein
MSTDKIQEKIAARQKAIADKKKDLEVVAKAYISYDGETFVKGEKFKMTKEDYQKLKGLDAVISAAELKAQKDKAIKEAKAKVK